MLLRKRKGLEALPVSTNYAAAKQAAFNRLADTVRQNMNMEKLRFYKTHKKCTLRLNIVLRCIFI